MGVCEVRLNCAYLGLLAIKDSAISQKPHFAPLRSGKIIKPRGVFNRLLLLHARFPFGQGSATFYGDEPSPFSEVSHPR